jgi:uncharacterized protein YbjQ (UPF0145 family)
MELAAMSMLVATIASIEGRPVQWYLGIVSGDAALSEATLRGSCGGDAGGSCEVALREARERATRAMLGEAAERGANAVLGVGFAVEPVRVGDRGGRSWWSPPAAPPGGCEIVEGVSPCMP